MARDHARILHRIWRDPEFLARPAEAQRAYLLLLSQESMNYAGVLDLTVGRWARYAPDTGIGDVRAALADLQQHRFVVVDTDTEEVLVRTFIRNDDLWKNVRMLRVAVREALGTQSPALRRALGEELGRLPRVVVPDAKLREGKAAAEARACQQELDDAVATLMAAPAVAPGAIPAPAPAEHVESAPEPAPSAAPLCARASGDGDGDGDGDGVGALALGDSKVDLEGDVTEVDARADEPDAQPDDVPDTRPAPLEEPRHEPPPPAPRENAMPPARCRNHLELNDPPPCGRCADARRAQEAWIADRDAKVAAARAAVQAEAAEQRRLERAAIDGCERCDDRGILPSNVVCTHDAEAGRNLPGRAEWRNARRMLEQRRAGRGADEPATGDQLRKLAISFGEHGNNDRAERLAWCSRNVGRDIGSTTELTKAEASKLIDLLEAEPPPADDDGVIDAVIYCGTEHCPLPDEHDGPCPVPEHDDQGDEEPAVAYSPEALVDDADAMEAAVLAARDQADHDHDQPDDEPWHTTGWAEDIDGPADDEPAAYAYAGSPDDPPF